MQQPAGGVVLDVAVTAERLLRSITAARGAISLLAKLWTASRIASAVLPRSRLNMCRALRIMVERLRRGKTLFEAD
ncbi:hypothetical protein [Bradyrhizobium lablabi]|uniref:hypothetical protein n=1 Tax=Bradyrhizobium lablabi TaxID=722472 RepID=UPI0024BF693E|nr:hypothetical protein [Bradyrhizobium lablabi]